MEKSVVRGLVFAPGAGKRAAVNGALFPYETEFVAANRQAMPFVAPNADDWNSAGKRRITLQELEGMLAESESRRAAQTAALEQSRARVERMRMLQDRADASTRKEKRTILFGGQYDDLYD